MFTGLVEKTGKLKSLQRDGRDWVLSVVAEPWETPLIVGESVAVQGACLTVTAANGGEFCCNVLDETLRRTSLGAKRPGDRLNLERALRLGDRLGGHMVTGHVDGVGNVVAVVDRGADTVLRVRCDAELLCGIVSKGSIACDGVSLTVSAVLDDGFEVCLIPHTWKATSLSDLRQGDLLNLETDLVGKHVVRWLERRQDGHGQVTLEALGKAGFC